MFLVLDYVTITRDPKTALVVAIGGNQRGRPPADRRWLPFRPRPTR
ncbi:hypothetical protein ACFUTV_26535 [Streptomyces sp. NPDC057298]